MHLRCPHCQNPIEFADVPSVGEITCAGCGSSFQLDNSSTATLEGASVQRVGRFEIMHMVGQGAFGSVFKARDPELDRIVAIKVPRAGNVGRSQEELDRFLREARSVAQLRFPSIITIHEVGIDNASPYLVCDFVEGITLADMLTARRFNFTESAKLLAEVADALQYAHSLGVVHRDVKPSNIMVTRARSASASKFAADSLAGASSSDLKPVLMDFGLAKRDAGEITMTMDGHILGTPAYMSPEQARGEGHHVDGRTDVYSLGVILYQLLTGELPFRGNKAMLLHQVLHDEPLRPRTLNDKIPRDLETIALKAMTKEPGRRYGSAKAMADDLRHWLAGEAITARPVSSLERTWRWCKRKPALATASSAAMLAGLAALITFAVAFFVVNDLRDHEHKERMKAEKLVLKQRFDNLQAAVSQDPLSSILRAAYLLKEAERLDDVDLQESICTHLSVWANLWGAPGGPGQYVSRSKRQAHAAIWSILCSPNGEMIISVSADNTAQLWKAGELKPFGPPLVHGGRIDALNAVRPVAFSADGGMVLTYRPDSELWLWETATGKVMCPPMKEPMRPLSAAFTPDGQLLVVSHGFDSPPHAKSLREVRTGQTLPPNYRQPYFQALSFDGKLGVMNGQLVATLTGETVLEKKAVPQPAWAGPASFTPDEKRVVTPEGLWDSASGKRIGPAFPKRWDERCYIRGDGKIVATVHADTRPDQQINWSVQLWNSEDGKLRGRISNSTSAISSVVFNPNGKSLAIACHNHAELWEIDTLKKLASIDVGKNHAIGHLTFSRTGKTIMTVSGNGIRFWDAHTGTSLGSIMKADSMKQISPDGKMLLYADVNGVRLVEVATGRPLGPPIQTKQNLTAIAFSANNRCVMTGHADGTMLEWPIHFPIRGTSSEIILWAQIRTEMELNEQDTIVHLHPKDRADRRRRLKEINPELWPH